MRSDCEQIIYFCLEYSGRDHLQRLREENRGEPTTGEITFRKTVEVLMSYSITYIYLPLYPDVLPVPGPAVCLQQ